MERMAASWGEDAKIDVGTAVDDLVDEENGVVEVEATAARTEDSQLLILIAILEGHAEEAAGTLASSLSRMVDSSGEDGVESRTATLVLIVAPAWCMESLVEGPVACEWTPLRHLGKPRATWCMRRLPARKSSVRIS
jgi:hypothetical protein